MTSIDRINRHARLLLSLLAAAALVPARAALAEDARPAEIRIAQHRYEPRVITVSAGTTLRWVNEDEDPHTVTADGGAFASRGIDVHEAFTFTFSTPGTYRYHCALHPDMTARVVVK
ncbi:MAG TPA: cupredoxin domain-containing protein [Anaeromyxobacteraceae bacterium]|nr:cupredoxin domain-containing protein [Anaeromyxobacteraceae bacterium]